MERRKLERKSLVEQHTKSMVWTIVSIENRVNTPLCMKTASSILPTSFHSGQKYALPSSVCQPSRIPRMMASWLSRWSAHISIISSWRVFANTSFVYSRIVQLPSSCSGGESVHGVHFSRAKLLTGRRTEVLVSEFGGVGGLSGGCRTSVVDAPSWKHGSGSSGGSVGEPDEGSRGRSIDGEKAQSPERKADYQKCHSSSARTWKPRRYLSVPESDLEDF